MWFGVGLAKLSLSGWFIQNIQDYSKMCPNGLSILNDKVKRRFPADDTWVEWDHARAYEYESSVAELVQEILQRHASGIEFREYNVGCEKLLRESRQLTTGRTEPRHGHARRGLQPEDLGRLGVWNHLWWKQVQLRVSRGGGYRR